MNINTWEIEYDDKLLLSIEEQINYEISNSLFCGTKLLNLNKSKYNVIEKFVYDYTIHHLKSLNYDINNIYVEFWFKNKFDTHLLHVDCDEFEKKTSLKYIYPLLSSVSYFNNSDIPTMITNIDMERYKYKDFYKDISLYITFPRINKQITFEPKYFHGSSLLNEIQENKRLIIAINLWSRKPTNIDFYESNNEVYNKNEIIFNYKNINNNIIDIPLSNNIINYDFIENILYKNEDTLFYKFKNIIYDLKQNEIHNIYKLFLDDNCTKKETNSKLKNKYGDIINDINEILDNENIKYNRFLQRFTYNNFYNSDVCKWIINESEKYAKLNEGWTTKRHNNYPTTDLPVERITSIFSYVLQSLDSISKIIKQSYGIDDSIVLDINDIFIVKYKHDEQNSLDLHEDGSFITFNILLNSNSEFEGGGTYFDDGLTVKPNQGDLLIHCGKIKHSGISITKGIRYLLVGFINIKLFV